ncbi:MAG: hypothetical protein LBJ80_00095 [Rickettsiales bacterium]|nr:hypothetical protein [Rickettsiales bacterium]
MEEKKEKYDKELESIPVPKLSDVVLQGMTELQSKRDKRLMYNPVEAQDVVTVSTATKMAQYPEFNPVLKRLTPKGIATPSTLNKVLKQSNSPSKESASSSIIVEEPSPQAQLVKKLLLTDIIEFPEIQPFTYTGEPMKYAPPIAEDKKKQMEIGQKLISNIEALDTPQHYGIPNELEVKKEYGEVFDKELNKILSDPEAQKQISEEWEKTQESHDQLRNDYSTNLGNYTEANAELKEAEEKFDIEVNSKKFQKYATKQQKTEANEYKTKELDPARKLLQEFEQTLKEQELEVLSLPDISNLYKAAKNDYKKAVISELDNERHTELTKELTEIKTALKYVPIGETKELESDLEKVRKHSKASEDILDIYTAREHLLKKEEQINEAHNRGGYINVRKLPELDEDNLPKNEDGSSDTARAEIFKQLGPEGKRHFEIGSKITGQRRLVSPLRYSKKNDGNLVLNSRNMYKMIDAGLDPLLRDSKKHSKFGVHSVNAYGVELKGGKESKELIDYTNDFWADANNYTINENISTAQQMGRNQGQIKKSIISLKSDNPVDAKKYRESVEPPSSYRGKYSNIHIAGQTPKPGIYAEGGKLMYIDIRKDATRKAIATIKGGAVVHPLREMPPIKPIAPYLSGKIAPPPGITIKESEILRLAPENSNEAKSFSEIIKTDRPDEEKRIEMALQTPEEMVAPGGTLYNVAVDKPDGTRRPITLQDITPEFREEVEFNQSFIPSQKTSNLHKDDKNILGTSNLLSLSYDALGIIEPNLNSPAMFLRSGRPEGGPFELIRRNEGIPSNNIGNKQNKLFPSSFFARR